MMGTGGGSGGGTSGLNSLYDVVSLIGDDTRYSEKIRELTAKIVEAEGTLKQANENNREAQAVRTSAEEMLAQVDAKLKQAAKEREDHQTAIAILEDRERALHGRHRVIENEGAALEAHKIEVIAHLKGKHEEHERREAEVKDFVQANHAQVAELRKRTDEECRAILARANAELQAAQSRREEAEAQLVEAETLRREHEDRLSRLVDLASGKQTTGELNG